MKRAHTPTLHAFLLAVLAAAAMFGGCVSAAFERTVRHVTPDLAGELRAYARADESIDTAERARRIAVAETFERATQARPMSYPAVRDAFAAFRPLYTAYTDDDVLLSPSMREVRAEVVAKYDVLVTEEGRRFIHAGQ